MTRFEKEVHVGEETLTVNWLMYKSYEFQRDNAPDVDPNRWRKFYFYQEDYEKIYQALRSNHVSISQV